MGLEPTTSCLHGKGTTTRAKGEPEVVGRGSGSYPVEEQLILQYVRTPSSTIFGIGDQYCKSLSFDHLCQHLPCKTDSLEAGEDSLQ